MHQEKVIDHMDRRSDGISMITDDLKTLTHQYSDTSDAPWDPPHLSCYTKLRLNTD